MKITKFFFRILIIVFFVFAVVVVNYQFYRMTDEEGGSHVLTTYMYFLLDVVCLLIIAIGSYRKYHGVHLVCLFWVPLVSFFLFFNHNQVSNIIRVILWPLLFEATYLCCRNFSSRSLQLKKVYFILAFVGGYYFLMTRIGFEHQSNTIYLVFLTLPWLLFESKKTLQLVILFLFTFFAMLSLKRSMLLSTVLIWTFYFLFTMNKRRNRIYTIILSLVLLAGVYVLYDKVDESLGGLLTERVNREETDSGRDRLAIWNLTMNMIQNSPPEKILIGHGHFAVRNDSYLAISAHNDFLEVFYDYGIIIFILYLCLWGHVIRRSAFLYKIRSPYFLPYASSLAIFIIMSLVSHLILYVTYFNYLVMFWAMMEALVENNNVIIHKDQLS